VKILKKQKKSGKGWGLMIQKIGGECNTKRLRTHKQKTIIVSE
jgi:hypothetical protein